MNLAYLERVDPTRNMLRFYSVQIAPTLLGASSGNGGGSARLVGSGKAGSPARAKPSRPD